MHELGPYRVFVDANVWFSRTIRDWLGMLYTTPQDSPFVVYWTEDVLAELIYQLRKQHPDWSGTRITQIRDQLAGTFESGRVTTFDLDAKYGGSDPEDAHVHAAAVACRANALLTCNTGDFVGTDNLSYEIMHPDDFLILVDDSAPQLVAAVTTSMCDHWLGRTGEADLPRMLRKAQCPQFAGRILNHLHRQI